MTSKSSTSNLRRGLIASGLIVCFLTFVGGAFVAEFHLFPYSLIFENAFAYIHATDERQEMEAYAQAETVEAASPDKARVTIPASADAYDGYTFLTFDTPRPSTARLIDMRGNVIHEWHRPFREIWPDPPHHPTPSPESAIAWRYAELSSNGDIITTIISYGDTPYGYGLVKLDKDSKVIWAVPDNFHHHFSIGADGRIFGLTHQWRNTREQRVAGAPQLPKRVLEDFVVELSPEGKELSRTSLLDAIAAPGYRELLGSAFAGDFHAKAWDPIHANDVEVIEPEFASHFPFMQPGMVMVSLREMDALILVDLKTRGITWALRGAWLRQHDPDLLSNGHVLLFDNRGDHVKGGGSRILELDPASSRIAWSYAGTSKQPFRSDKSGGQQRLPNGNTLVSEDDAGRVFEVNPSGKIVWEYRDVRLHHATRVTKDWIKFVPNAPESRGATTTPAGL